MFVGDTNDRNICMGGTTGSRVGTAALPAGQRPVLIWRVAARLESFDGATAVIGVRWSREVLGDDIQPAGPFEGQFTWRVSEGSFRTLDFVRQAPAAVDGCDTMGVELSVQGARAGGTARGGPRLRRLAGATTAVRRAPHTAAPDVGPAGHGRLVRPADHRSRHAATTGSDPPRSSTCASPAT